MMSLVYLIFYLKFYNWNAIVYLYKTTLYFSVNVEMLNAK